MDEKEINLEAKKPEGLVIAGAEIRYDCKPYTALLYASMITRLAEELANQQGAPAEITGTLRGASLAIVAAGGGNDAVMRAITELALDHGQTEIADKLTTQAAHDKIILPGNLKIARG